jgi:uncharacterized protein
MMMRLKPWQWVVLAVPVVLVVGFVLVSAGLQIHQWRINWIWAVFTLLFVGWRWLLVRWTQPVAKQVEAAITQVSEELRVALDQTVALEGSTQQKTEAVLQTILTQVQSDLPIWEDWSTFWRRCQELVVAVARIYHPEVKYPLLNIYIPQAYGLIRGTVDELDVWMQKLAPVLNQVTVGQGYQAYEVYRQLEPSARKLWEAWSWAQWVLNPVVAVAQRASQPFADQANQKLLANLGQLLREAALRNLWHQSILLYSGLDQMPAVATPTLPPAKTQTLREILAQAEPVEQINQRPINLLLVGRTGAGKSSLINTLFATDLATVNLLPETDRIQSYQWQTEIGETLTLWDTPGYEQVSRTDFRRQVLTAAQTADLLLLATPALDPALQMDADFLQELKAEKPDLKTIVVVTQVDRLRPLREWQPPYDWQWGTRPKEIAIREATEYRSQALGEYCDWVLPVVTADRQMGRSAWGTDALSRVLVEALEPAKQFRLAQFLRDLDARSLAAGKVIDRYVFQMKTTQGLAALLKSPVLVLLAARFRGFTPVAVELAEQIPIEQVPTVIGKLQMAYDLYMLFNTEKTLTFDLPAIWQLALNQDASPEQTAWALGQTLIEYWTQALTREQLKTRYQSYLESTLLRNSGNRYS